MYQIKGRFQHYDWGGYTFMPALFNIDNSDKIPFAEYWLGVHSGGPATVALNAETKTSLDALITSNKPLYLGKQLWKQFNKLPFLLKILDVNKMLSIQVHPNKMDAEAGFLRENEAKIPLSASIRNYKDENHKPEIMVALSDFWLLHGFASNIQERVDHYAFLNPFKEAYKEGGIRGLYESIMNLTQAEVNSLLGAHMQKALDQYAAGELKKTAPDYWAARACIDFKKGTDYDKGIFSIYLFNIVNLNPGQGIFQGAGMPHAYMEGQNIELMSNSDNVLRGGLTNKHIDVKELMNNILFVETVPHILNGDLAVSGSSYAAPVDDFKLTYFLLGSEQQMELQVDKPSVILLTEGHVKWISESKEIDSSGVDAVFVYPGENIKIQSCSITRLFIASIA
jgi:mannose-6-phosphate isomerase